MTSPRSRIETYLFLEPQQGATYESMLRASRLAASCGFSGVARSDHLLPIWATPHVRSPTDAMTTLAGLARDVEGIGLAVLVAAATFRHPAMLAIAAANIQTMSGGRFDLGLGAGWFEPEHEEFHIPLADLGARMSELGRQLEVVRDLFSGGQLVENGVRPPGLIVGGGGWKRTPMFAARFADEYNVPPYPHTAADVVERFDSVRAACERIGRDPATMRLSAAISMCCADDASDLARREGQYAEPLERLRRHAGYGGSSAVAERLTNYVEAGAERLYLRIGDVYDVEHIGLIAETVLPALV